MNANSRQDLDTLSSKVIGCAFSVSNSLGCGYLEKVYENALAVEFRYTGIAYSQQTSFLALDALTRLHQAQCMNYLKTTGLRLALWLNFGRPRVEVQRVVMKY